LVSSETAADKMDNLMDIDAFTVFQIQYDILSD
jgi:hypothetical protein